MKRFIFLALAFMAFAIPAKAANFNLTQPDTGTQFDSGSPYNIQIPVGQIHIPVLQSTVTTAKTSFIVVPATGLRVSSIQAVLQNRLTGSANTFRFWHLDSNGNMVGEVTNGTSAFTLTPPTTGNTGLITGKTGTFTPSTAVINTFTQGHVLAIQSAAGATLVDANSDVQFVVTFKPR